MDLKLEGKIALVTGGSHGIGRSIALALAEEGCNVAICARNRKRVDQVVEEIKAYGVSSLGITADAMIGKDVNRVMKSVIGKWKALHILVNNVGGGGSWGKEVIEQTPEEVWLDVYRKNALAAIRFTMQAIPYMRKQKGGRVVTVGSILGRRGGGRPWYSMAKSAESNLMKTLGANHQLARDGITFNSIEPGIVRIPGTPWDQKCKKNPKKFKELIDAHFPLGRPGTPQEIANVVLFVCSEKASLLNGAVIAVDGAEANREIYL